MTLSEYELSEKDSPAGVDRVKSGATHPVRGATQGSEGKDVPPDSKAHDDENINDNAARRSDPFFIAGEERKADMGDPVGILSSFLQTNSFIPAEVKPGLPCPLPIFYGLTAPESSVICHKNKHGKRLLF
jgi:hypothetical protein